VVNAGRISQRMSTEDGIKQYLGLVGDVVDVPLSQKPRTQHKPRAPIFTGLKMYGQSGQTNIVACGEGIRFEIEMENLTDPGELTCAVALFNTKNQRVAVFHSQYNSGMTFRATGDGRKKMTCTVPSLPLTPGSYYVELVVADGFTMLERVDRADRLELMFADLYGHGKLPSQRQAAVLLPCQWQE
jgi:hypothetical protein